MGPGRQSPNIRGGQRRPRGRKVRRGRQEEQGVNARAGGVTGDCQSSSHGLVSPGKAATVDRAADHVGWESRQRWVGGVEGPKCGNRGSAGSTGGLERRRWQEGGHRLRGAPATAQAQSEGSSLRSWAAGASVSGGGRKATPAWLCDLTRPQARPHLLCRAPVPSRGSPRRLRPQG